jgi:hypothetical protein
MFLLDIPFNGCQGRTNRSSIVHAVSYFACDVNDTAFILKKSYFFMNSNLYYERLLPLNQGPRTDVSIKNTDGRKSRDTGSLRHIT